MSIIYSIYIQVLKLYAWEPSFQGSVEEIRNSEVRVLKQAAYLSAGTSFIWTCAPFLVRIFFLISNDICNFGSVQLCNDGRWI